MDNEFIVYRSYEFREDALAVASLLEQNGIATEVANTPKRLDSVLVGTEFDNRIVLRIRSADFPRANQVLFDNTQVDLSTLDSDHPILALNNEELMDVIRKPDEWGADNYGIAKALLARRGVAITGDMAQQMKAERIEALSQRKKAPFGLLLAGYFFVIASLVWAILLHTVLIVKRTHVWIVPGAMGLFIGILIAQAKTTLPDGRKVQTYTNTSIKHGMVMIGLTILAWILNVLEAVFAG